jgi:hypothetical protein
MKSNHSMPNGKTKEKTERMNIGAKGGTTKMFGKSGAAVREPSISAPTRQQAFGKEAPKGGRTGVMGKQRGAAAAVSGQVSPGGRGGDNTFKVSGGSGHMAGNSGSQIARPR